ncbi:MAG: NusG domain II-containing protein [Actinobacteria bacterium]|nr:MAG: NusG domain II-containing protein [Actinomycetota bacterium]
MLTKIDKTIIVIIMIAALVSLPLAISASSAGNAKKILVYKSGKKIASYSIEEDRMVKVKDANGGYCLLKIQDSKVYVAKSTCPLKICQKQGRIEKAGQSIICAPMRLMYQIESTNNNSSLDAINE